MTTLIVIFYRLEGSEGDSSIEENTTAVAAVSSIKWLIPMFDLRIVKCNLHINKGSVYAISDISI